MPLFATCREGFRVLVLWSDFELADSVIRLQLIALNRWSVFSLAGISLALDVNFFGNPIDTSREIERLTVGRVLESAEFWSTHS